MAASPGLAGRPSEPLAIVGLATRFPQDAYDTEAFWKFLLHGKSAYSRLPEDRIGPGHYHPDPEHGGTHAVQGGHFLVEDPACFDAPFFGITKGEATAIDPQQRLVLENVYHALENAGYALDKVSGTNTSVYVSGFNHDYLSIQNADPEMASRFKATGMTNSMLSNRLSWFLNANGPSMTIDTACSSSMVALHLGCQSLHTKESSMSIVSGVTVISYPGDITNMSHQGFLGQDGKCFSFDSRAAGYARGEGVGSVIVKRLADAVRDGDTIRAVIRGTGVNQDGKTPGLTLPDSAAQESLIRSVYSSAGLSFDETAMVEAHGTGTAVGDPIEANALARAFSSRPKDQPLIVGAVKSGTGHLEGAAGVAGIIKAVLILEAGVIPPNVNFEKVNPKIPSKKWNLQFPISAMPWPTEGPRRISVNSFGVGGTNAHTILDDAYHFLTANGSQAKHSTCVKPPSQAALDAVVQSSGSEGQEMTAQTTHLSHGSSRPYANEVNENGYSNSHMNGQSNGVANGYDHDFDIFGPIPGPPQLMSLSAFDEEGIKRNAKIHRSFWDSEELEFSSTVLQDASYTLSQRSRLPWRSTLLARSRKELIDALASPAKAMRARSNVSIGYVFTGQGAQHYAMARELLCYPAFRATLLQAEENFSRLGAKWSLLEELAKDKSDTLINEAYLAQPACTAIQIALVDLLASWNVRPNRVVGHSSGEIAAAFCSGKLTRESAYTVAYARGVVSSKPTRQRGAMLAAGLGEADLQAYLEARKAETGGELVIACVNSPKNCTVSGDEHLIDALRQSLDHDGVFARKLNVKNAYHSSHMKEVADEYLAMLKDISAPSKSPFGAVQMFSSVTRSYVEGASLDAPYWVDNLLSPVQFSEALTALCFSRGQQKQASMRAGTTTANVFADLLVELGPHGALQSAIKESVLSRPVGAGITSMTALNRSQPGAEIILGAVGYLYCRGVQVDIDEVNRSAADIHRPPKLLTTLPGYAFNHSQRFWEESRLSKNYRLRKKTRHDLLGAPTPDWNDDTPRWRHFLRVSEQPWLRDHIVTNAIVYPGVGYLIAAIEAARQMADPNLQVTGFRLRDVSLKRALVIPDNKDGVETMFSLSAFDEASMAPSAVWRRFEMRSYNATADNWLEHCTGYVTVDYEKEAGPIDQGKEAKSDALRSRQMLLQADKKCITDFDISQTYENLVTTGLRFGPLFRNVSNATGTGHRDGEVFGTVTVPDVAESMPKRCLSDHVIHPATMDSFMHFALAAIMDSTGKTNLESPTIPTFIKDVWLSAEVSSQPGHEYVAHGRAKLAAFEKYESDVTVWDKDLSESRISLKGIRATPLDSAAQGQAAIRELCHELHWVPYLECTKEPHIEHPPTNLTDDATARDWNRKLQLASVTMILDALDELDTDMPTDLSVHLQRYLDWMKQIRSWLEEDKISSLSKSEWVAIKDDHRRKVELYDEVAGHNANGKLAVRMGQQVVAILRGEEDPLNLMFAQDDILDQVYSQVAFLNELPHLQREYLSVVAANRTNLRLLEVGAGTGSSTVGILETLAPSGTEEGGFQSSIANYTYTDISSAFFEKARDKFSEHDAIMDYKVFDAEKDPEKQGFELGSYDFVVAQNVVHATASLQTTLSTISKLLKSGGRLLLQEGVRQDYFWSGIAFGLLPGWWLGTEPERKWSPWISSPQWDAVLKKSGFRGTELELRDSREDDLHTQSLFVARALATEVQHQDVSVDVAIILPEVAYSVSKELCNDLQSRLKSLNGVKSALLCSVANLVTLPLSRTLCICVAETERTLLADLTAEQYESVRRMLVECNGLLWVTGDVIRQPMFGMITGLLRTVRWERDLDDANLVTLSLSDAQNASVASAKAIVDLFEQQFLQHLPREQYHGEYMLQDGRILTARLRKANSADKFLTSKFNKLRPVPTMMKDAGRPIKLSSAAPGILDRLEWITDEAYNESLGDTEVEIEIKAVGLNFRDLMIAMGEHMAYSIGSEGAGTISRIGKNVTDVKVGDRVVYIPGMENVATFHTYGRIDQQTVVKLPDSLGFEIAAGLPVVYATVLYGLREVGRLSEGEKILIHAAAGGVGQAAIHYAKHVGAEIFATVSSVEKRQLLMDTFGIPEDHIFSSRDLSFVKGVTRMTDGKGVDLILNSLSGEALRRSWELLAPFGRFIEIGKKDAQLGGRVELRPFLQNVTMASVDLITMMKYKPALIKRLIDDMVRLWSEGVVKAAEPTKIMPMSQTLEAFQTLQTGRGMGKMVLVPHPDDVVPIVPAQPKSYEFRGDATYVLAGGLGGIGRSSAKWMASQGARHFLFLSSSGRITESVTQMKSELEADECSVTIRKCDVSDKAALKDVLNGCKDTLPKIKGVIQGAMKLSDCMFENMDHETFQLATKPKVQGSWNLHELLPKDLDHFIMLSSATGVLGNRSQANYAAGNTFQDALAKHRRSLGLAASTLDLGTVLSVGYVAENLERVAMAKHLNTVLEVIREDEIHALLEYLMDSQHEAPSQLVSGLTTMETYRSRGAPAPTYIGYPLFTHLSSVSSQRAGGSDGSGGPAVEVQLAAARTLEEAAGIVTKAVVAKLASLLSVAVDDIAANRSVSANGVDSLVAMEFRTFLAREVKADVPVLDIMGTLSITDLCKKIAAESKAVDVKEAEGEQGEKS